MEFKVISKTNSGDLEVAQFVFKSDAERFIKAMDMPIGYHRIEPIMTCTCGKSFMSKADCPIHGISEQLNRTQME